MAAASFPGIADLWLTLEHPLPLTRTRNGWLRIGSSVSENQIWQNSDVANSKWIKLDADWMVRLCIMSFVITIFWAKMPGESCLVNTGIKKFWPDDLYAWSGLHESNFHSSKNANWTTWMSRNSGQIMFWAGNVWSRLAWYTYLYVCNFRECTCWTRVASMSNVRLLIAVENVLGKWCWSRSKSRRKCSCHRRRRIMLLAAATKDQMSNGWNHFDRSGSDRNVFCYLLCHGDHLIRHSSLRALRQNAAWVRSSREKAVTI
jgi:hypothetical protein